VRIQQLTATVPIAEDEAGQLETLLWQTGRWRAATDDALRQAVQFAKSPEDLAKPTSHRLVQVIRALSKAMLETPNTKVVVFATWWPTLSILLQPLEQMFGRGVMVPFHAGLTAMELQNAVDLFQSTASCGILICDELGGEGRNFQIADHIIHADLPWTPAQIEQRIGRVDRLGRKGNVRSVVVFARDFLDGALFDIWQDAFHLFTESMSGLEIALEGIQTELAASLHNSVRDGINSLHAQMVHQAENLRAAVEEERYFEENAINRRRREEFATTEARYRDGKLLRTTFLRWASLAGLRHDYNSLSDILTFDPRDFSIESMQNAKMFQLPNMEDAFRRARYARTLTITGTFNRDIAVRREDLVFFAPGTDAWTDAIVANALEADRGRCCAIYRKAPELPSDWRGFELLYSLTVDPRSLYESGADPIHLFRAQGYLQAATYRLLIGQNGQLVKANSPVVAVVDRPFDKAQDVHLGKRDGRDARIKGFKDAYPPDAWNSLLQRVFAVAEAKLDEELSFLPDEAEEAQRDFVQRALGWKASDRWRQREFAWMTAPADIDEYERASEALVAGLARPVRRLESVCFWVLRSGTA
jgi:hypothetical protein